MKKRALSHISALFLLFVLASCASQKIDYQSETISLQPDWEFATYAKIADGQAVLYYTQSDEPKNRTVCINAGHGTKNGTKFRTLCHPDGSPKIVSGSTAAGATTAFAVTVGTEMESGLLEATVNLRAALIVKERLLEAGYNVLMIRERRNVQLDNIARAVIANACADCHIAIHYDGTSSDKGAFFLSVPDEASYKAMEPVASHWEEHERLGRCIIAGLKDAGVKIYGDGEIPMDLTQTSFSTIPSIDLEVGDRMSRYRKKQLRSIAEGILIGLDAFFLQN